MSEEAALLKQLIGCRSITPAHGGALDLAQSLLTEAGFAARRLPAGEVDNLWAADSEQPRLIFAGHVDVVPPGDLENWDSDPFAAVERDGFIYGRGAADMKSGVAAMLMAARRLRRRGVSGIAVLLTADEEGAAVHGTRHVVEWWQNNGGGRVPFVIVGEPTCEKTFGDTIKIGRRGSLTARITVRGRQTHVAYPNKGDNPIPRLLAVLDDLLGEFPPAVAATADGFPPTVAQAVAVSSGGDANNVIPAAALATVNFRYAPPEDEHTLRRATEACLRRTAPQWQCEWTHGAQPFMTGADGVLVRTLQHSIAAVCGVTAGYSAAGGTSDGRFLRTMCDELAEFGVVNETMHAVNERVAADSVRMLAEIYERTAHKLLSS